MIKILDVVAEIGNAPGDALVVADDDRRHTRQRNAGDIETGRLQVHLIPRRGNRPLQVRIAGQNRLAAGRVLARDNPGVRARLKLGSGARSVNGIHFGGIAVRQHGHLPQFVPPGGGQCPIHLQSAQQAVRDGPWPRIVAQEREFERQAAAMRFDEVVDAARVGRHHGAVGGRQRAGVLLGDAAHFAGAGTPGRVRAWMVPELRTARPRPTAAAHPSATGDPGRSRSLGGKSRLPSWRLRCAERRERRVPPWPARDRSGDPSGGLRQAGDTQTNTLPPDRARANRLCSS